MVTSFAVISSSASSISWVSSAERLALRGPAAGPPGAGRPRCGATGLRYLRVNIFTKKFTQNPLPPRSGAVGVYFCKFQKQKYIFFVKNENKEYKNIKTAREEFGKWISYAYRADR